MIRVDNIRASWLRILAMSCVVALAAGCGQGKQSESSGSSSDSGATSSNSSTDAGSSAATNSPAAFQSESGGGHLVKVAAGMSSDQMAKAKSLAEAKGCFACHQVEAKVVGPAFAWVAYKYKGDPKALATVSHAIEHGVAGVWGGMPMPAQNVTPEQARELASWVLAQKPIAPPKAS